MKNRVLQVIAVAALSIMGVGCATSGKLAHGPRHSVAEVELALRDTECSALTRMADSIDLETAQAARRIAIGECR
jgi:hypothetical protein